MKLSIHDTHRLPFFNATITAKQLSSSTTPVVFRTYTGETIGTTVKTNASGFLCRSDGTPYVDGVFVDEEAIVTATLKNGTSTSWVVGPADEVTAYDGILFGKLLDDSYVGTDYIEIGGKKYKKLFTANQQGNGRLSLFDLADVPSFVNWTDDQQIEDLDLANLNHSASILVGIQTKVIILRPVANRTPPEYPTEFTVLLSSSLSEEGKTRYGRNFTVTNITTVPIVLKNQGDYAELAVGTVQPGSSVVVAETYPYAPYGSDIGGTPFYIIADNGELATGAYTSYKPTLSTDGNATVKLNDSTPAVLKMTGHTGRVPERDNLVWQLDCSTVTTARRVVLFRYEPDDSDSANIPVQVVTPQGVYICSLDNLQAVELWVAQDFAWPVNDYTKRATTGLVKLTSNTAMPSGKNSVGIDCSGISDGPSEYHDLRFIDDWSGNVRLEFGNASTPIWIRLCSVPRNGSTETYWDTFCIPAGSSRVSVSVNAGVIRVYEKSWKSICDIRYSGNGEWSCTATTFDIRLDVGEISAITNEPVFASTDSSTHDNVNVQIPTVAPNTILRLDIAEYTAASTSDVSPGIVLVQGSISKDILGSDSDNLLRRSRIRGAGGGTFVVVNLYSQFVRCVMNASDTTLSFSEIVREVRN